MNTSHTSPGVHFSGYRDAAVFWTFLLSPLFHQNKLVLPLSSHNNFVTWTKKSKSAVINRIKWFVCCNIQTFKDASHSSFDDPGLQQLRSSQSYQAQAVRDVSATFAHMLLFSRSAILHFHWWNSRWAFSYEKFPSQKLHEGTSGISLEDHKQKLPTFLFLRKWVLVLSQLDELWTFLDIKPYGSQLSLINLWKWPSFRVKCSCEILSDLPSDVQVPLVHYVLWWIAKMFLLLKQFWSLLERFVFPKESEGKVQSTLCQHVLQKFSNSCLPLQKAQLLSLYFPEGYLEVYLCPTHCLMPP